MFDGENLLTLSVAVLYFFLGYKYHQHLMEREEEEEVEEDLMEREEEEEGEYGPEDVNETYEICSSLFKYL